MTVRHIHILFYLAAGTAAVACGPRTRPAAPGAAPTDTAPTPRRAVGPPPPQEVLIGEMCPGRAGNRAAVLPAAVRRIVWSTAPEEVQLPVARGSARQFSVLAWDGRRAGVFVVAGAADVGLPAQVGIGAYAGSSPCAAAPDDGGSPPPEDPACVALQQHCGLALAVLEPAGGLEARPFEELPEPAAFHTGGACAAGGKLLVDLEGDGHLEAFPLAEFLDPLRGPADEVVAVPVGDSACAPQFAVKELVPAGDPRDWLGMDLLGVVDVDADGRHELVFSYRYPDRRIWAIYSAPAVAARLELVAEVVPWVR